MTACVIGVALRISPANARNAWSAALMESTCQCSQPALRILTGKGEGTAIPMCNGLPQLAAKAPRLAGRRFSRSHSRRPRR